MCATVLTRAMNTLRAVPPAPAHAQFFSSGRSGRVSLTQGLEERMKRPTVLGSASAKQVRVPLQARGLLADICRPSCSPSHLNLPLPATHHHSRCRP